MKMKKCPNICFNGKVPFYTDPDKALYSLSECPYCKGKGKVSETDYEQIDKKI